MYGFFIKWKANRSALHWIGFRFSYAKAQRARVMLNVEPTPGLSPRKIARGGGDGFLTAMTRMIAETGQVTYMRLLSEMNNGVNFYSPRDESGRSRGPAYSSSAFKQAWRRAAIILRGGERGEHEPAAEAPPPAEGPDGREAAAGGAGGPGLGAALVRQPGDRVQPPEALLARRRLRGLGGHHLVLAAPQRGRDGQVLRLPEVAAQAVHVRRVGRLGRRVAVGFVGKFFGFLKSHPRVRMAVYYQSANLKPEFRLSTHPRSRAALRGAVRWPRLLGLAPEFGG